MPSKRKKLWIVLGVYVFLWGITGVFGLPEVDRAFDTEFVMGSPDGLASEKQPAIQVPVTRVQYVRISNPETQAMPAIPFRSRSKGLPVAPFVILDEVCVAQTPLAVFSGRRLVFWLPGFTRWMPLTTWWVA